MGKELHLPGVELQHLFYYTAGLVKTKVQRFTSPAKYKNNPILSRYNLFKTKDSVFCTLS